MTMQDPFPSQPSRTGRASVAPQTSVNSSQPVARPGPEVVASFGPISLSRQHEASARLEAELRSIALDLLGLYDSEELPPECDAWVRSTVEAAVAGICDPAVAGVAGHLRKELAAAPADIVRRIGQAKRRHEVGFA